MATEVEAAMAADVEQAVAFHGHMCPGLAIGVQAARYALREIGAHAQDEEVVAVVETDMCAVDAIQSLVGCTFGKGNLVHRDYGKNAFTFYRRSDGKGVRLVTRADGWGPKDPVTEELGKRARSGKATPEEQQEFWKLHRKRADAILARSDAELFVTTPVTADPPRPARIHTSLPCAECGEPTMETRTRQFGGKTMCIPCFERADIRA